MKQDIFDLLPFSDDNDRLIFLSLLDACNGAEAADLSEELSDDERVAVAKVAAGIQCVNILRIYRVTLAGDDDLCFRLFIDRDTARAVLWFDDDGPEMVEYVWLAKVTQETLLEAFLELMAEWRAPNIMGTSVTNYVPNRFPKACVERLIDTVIASERDLLEPEDPQTAAEFMQENYQEIVETR